MNLSKAKTPARQLPSPEMVAECQALFVKLAPWSVTAAKLREAASQQPKGNDKR